MGNEQDQHLEQAPVGGPGAEDHDETSDEVEELPPLKGLMDPESEPGYSPASDADAPPPG